MSKAKDKEKIKPIEKIPSVTEKIIDRLVQLISNGTFQPGDKLPSEKDLAKSLQVSRPSLREALSTLQIRGLLEIKPRSGTYVKSATPNRFREPLEQLLEFEPGKMWELLEIRKYVDSAAAELAALRRTEEDLKEFKALLKDVARIIHRKKEREQEVEKAYGHFFKQLSVSTHSTLFSHFIDSISDMVRKALPFSRIKLESIPRSKETIVDQLFALVKAIEDQHPDRARQLVIQHIEYVEHSLRKVIGNGANGTAEKKDFHTINQQR